MSYDMYTYFRYNVILVLSNLFNFPKLNIHICCVIDIYKLYTHRKRIIITWYWSQDLLISRSLGHILRVKWCHLFIAHYTNMTSTNMTSANKL